MSDQYNDNEYDQKAQQSAQDFRNQALNTGYDYFKNHGATMKGAATGSVGNTAAASAGNTAAVNTAASTAAGAAETGAAAGAAAGTGAVAGTAVAAGAPTGGIGALVVLALAALKAGTDRVRAEAADIGQETDINKESRLPFFLIFAIGILVVLCCIILLIPSCAMYFPQLMERDSIEASQPEVSTGTEVLPLFNAHSDKNEFFKRVLGVDSYDIEADNIVQEYRQIDNTNIGIYKSIIDHALWNAFNKHALSYCTDYDLLAALDFITDKDMTFEDKVGYILFFDSEAALENYRSKRYPYTATHDNSFYYTIGDYLDGKIPQNELNNLLNYAEIITVLSQSEKCSANSFSYSAFYDMLTSEQAEMLLFEIKFDKERTWSHEVIEEISAETEDKYGGQDSGDTPDSAPNHQDKQEGSTEKEDMDNSGTEDKNITAEPIPQNISTPSPKPQAPSKTPPVHEKNKHETPESNPPAKTKPVDSSKNDKKGKNYGISYKSAAITLQADSVPLKCMAFSEKLFRIMLPPSDLSGGAPVQPSPIPQTTPLPELPDQEATGPEKTEDSGSLGEEIAKQLIYKYGFYYDCEIAPYGLLELYTIAEADPDDMNANEYTMRNIDVLDISEKWLRTKITDVPLGTDTRSPMQYLDSNLISKGVEGLFSNAIYYKHAVGLRDQLSCNYIPDGQSVILDMHGYINQGRYPDNYRGTDGRGQSIKAAGCCDCSYTMIAMYLNRANYDIVTISRNYVSNNNFRGKNFLSSIGLTEDIRDGAYSASSVISYITEGLPVMLHISGKWVYNGITYHSSTNGHFLVIMGFDDVGFYVYDPGSNRNTTSGPIPYAAFSHVSGKTIRVISRKSTFMPHYLVNSYLE